VNLIFRAIEVGRFHWSFVTMSEVPILGSSTKRVSQFKFEKES
jgi:hypothetical protein